MRVEAQPIVPSSIVVATSAVKVLSVFMAELRTEWRIARIEVSSLLLASAGVLEAGFLSVEAESARGHPICRCGSELMT